MKTLFLMRHAKSSWKHPLPDEDRPLADRGERDAPRMGKRLAKRTRTPDLILSSPARRALATARIVAKKLGYEPKGIVVDARLYPSSARQLLDVVRGLDDRLKRVMLFGHNPGFANFARRLSNEIERMPTAAVAEFSFDSSWSKVGKIAPARVALDYPKKR
jgi:phosphohistidine phosphatase